jgi:hypothetical protein
MVLFLGEGTKEICESDFGLITVKCFTGVCQDKSGGIDGLKEYPGPPGMKVAAAASSAR